ncbi:unnamed protein product [Lupinus luteus]|uniref:Uncharacterized protein n=1 Tax=Lupinus luteus TaxID=3873 RepID=A0AAV1VYK9_LUPLU
MSDSLVRVSRRAEWGTRRPTPGARRCRSTPRRRALPTTIAMMTSPRACRQPELGPPSQFASVHGPSRLADRLSPFHIRPRHIAGPHPLPSRQFQALFDSLFKVLFIFPSQYLFAIGLSLVFSLGWNLPPDWGCIPKEPDSPTTPRGATGSGHDGALTLSGAPFQGTWARSATEDASLDYNSDSEGDRCSWWAFPGSLAVTKGMGHFYLALGKCGMASISPSSTRTHVSWPLFHLPLGITHEEPHHAQSNPTTTGHHGPHTRQHASARSGMARGDVVLHITCSKATLPLTIPRRVFKSSAKDSTPRPVGNSASRRPAWLVHPAGLTNGTCLWGPRPPNAGRQTGNGHTYCF